MRILFLGLLFLATLIANETSTDSENIPEISLDFDRTIENNSTDEIQVDENSTDVEVIEKVLYLNFKEIPQRVVKGEIFSITIKTLSTIQGFTDVEYDLLNSKGLKILNSSFPYREEDSKYYYDTFYFLAENSQVKLPDFEARLVDNYGTKYKNTTLIGPELNVITLNPKKNFSNIVASSFELQEYKTSSYDYNHNIVVFAATAKNCDISTFKLKGVFKQGVESKTESIFDSKITYYAIIDKEIENFSFSYFDLSKNKFSLITIPIIVIDDSVTTQTDLKPKDQSRERLKMSIAGGVALLGFIFILWRKKYIYLFLTLIPLAYIVYLAIPSNEVCIKQGSNIYLLPVHNSTIFETTSSRYYLLQEGSVKKFVKVKLENQKIGWVKNEDLCTR